MTNEELDQARAEEAFGQSKAGDLFTDIAANAARLAREGWTPPKVVDLDREEADKLMKNHRLVDSFALKILLEAIKRGRELERAALRPQEKEG